MKKAGRPAASWRLYARFRLAGQPAAARALVDNTQLEATEIVNRAMKIAGDICIYTNTNITVLETT